eukprot:1619676-Alexandrium_andersonii.AAC.1
MTWGRTCRPGLPRGSTSASPRGPRRSSSTRPRRACPSSPGAATVASAWADDCPGALSGGRTDPGLAECRVSAPFVIEGAQSVGLW